MYLLTLSIFNRVLQGVSFISVNAIYDADKSCLNVASIFINFITVYQNLIRITYATLKGDSLYK